VWEFVGEARKIRIKTEKEGKQGREWEDGIEGEGRSEVP